MWTLSFSLVGFWLFGSCLALSSITHAEPMVWTVVMVQRTWK